MRELSQILKDKEFRFKKAFGQNFISDKNLLDAICADSGVSRDDTVVEIGAGGGTLTARLSATAKNVVAFEIDKNLQPILSETLEGLDNIQMVFGDAMKIPVGEINRIAGNKPYRVVANLPYYITSPLILKLIEEGANLISMTVMVQKEVAERLAAKEDTEAYGSITVAVDSVADVKITRIVNRKMFYPAPNVDSAVVHMDFKNKYNIDDSKLFKKVYRSAFLMRRKTLVNNLISGFGFERETCGQLLNSCDIALNARGETLGTSKFVELYKKIAQL